MLALIMERMTERNDTKRAIGARPSVLIACAIIAALTLFVGWHWWRASVQEERDRLAIVPEPFAVHEIVWADEECTGIGLSGGDDCAGVFVFDLPETTAREIAQRGAIYFAEVGPLSAVERWGSLESWQATPIPIGPEWWDSRESQPTTATSATLFGFLGPDRFLLDIDPQIARDIDAALAAPGSFVARDRFGFMLVSPSQRTVAYAYRN